MLILTIKTDQPEAELALYEDDDLQNKVSWQAHRQLAETIHAKIKELLAKQGQTTDDIKGIVCFKGPGSFTGLRIGLSVGNALAYGLAVSVVSQEGQDWQVIGIKRLITGENEVTAMPEYGAEAHITKPRK
jgi:tRNA threonylcarbamoyladenosine biosynthesis protein TsaB